MDHIDRSIVDGLMADMIKWRGLAFKNYTLANNIVQSYRDKYEQGGSRFASKVDAERSAASDIRYINAVASNQMYDRFAMRDAAVLSATLKMAELGLLRLKAEPNNPTIVPLTRNSF